MIRKTLILTALYGALAVILGALSAHTLKGSLSDYDLSNFKTAVFYQIIHVIAILAINAYPQFPKVMKTMISHTFLTGITLFSGSIYLISLHWLSTASIWWLTPVGGVLLITGWLMLAFALYKVKAD